MCILTFWDGFAPNLVKTLIICPALNGHGLVSINVTVFSKRTQKTFLRGSFCISGYNTDVLAYTRTHARTCACTHTRTHANVYIHAYAHIHTRTPPLMHAPMWPPYSVYFYKRNSVWQTHTGTMSSRVV
jgi:hypothetical protein